jgi:hypothetical protein
MSIARKIAVGSTVLFGGVIAFAADPAAPTTAPATHRASYSEYAVVAEKNIFLRDRSRPAPTSRSGNSSTSSSTQRAQKSAEETLVLTGVVFEDGEFHAYVEDTSAEKILKLAPGDTVAHGRIAQIEIDAVLYQTLTKPPLWVDIGSDFTGKAYGSFSDSTSYSGSGSSDETPSTGPASSQPAINPNDPNLTVEQRMRLRAQQQRSSGRR